jgi:Spy/CpxP family protein refolding chaperone
MDLIRQNKFIGWVIAMLVALNLLTLTIIWFQMDKKNQPPVNADKKPTPGSVRLMQNEIGLSDDQANQFEQMRSDHMKKTKELNDALDDLKLRVVDELFNPHSGQSRVDSIAAKIGTLQSQLEIMRFEHFRALVQICNTEQKEKLYPVLREVFSKKGPNDKAEIKSSEQRKRDKAEIKIGAIENRLPGSEDRNAPPSKEQKLDRYAERLALTSDQIKKVDEILASTRTKEEAFKLKFRPSPSEFELEKENIRKEEDGDIMRILNPDQKKEFEKMMKNRGKHMRN